MEHIGYNVERMKFTMLGGTGLVVSRLALGALTFTQGNKALRSVCKVGAELADQLFSADVSAFLTGGARPAWSSGKRR